MSIPETPKVFALNQTNLPQDHSSSCTCTQRSRLGVFLTSGGIKQKCTLTEPPYDTEEESSFVISRFLWVQHNQSERSCVETGNPPCFIGRQPLLNYWTLLNSSVPNHEKNGKKGDIRHFCFARKWGDFSAVVEAGCLGATTWNRQTKSFKSCMFWKLPVCEHLADHSWEYMILWRLNQLKR